MTAVSLCENFTVMLVTFRFKQLRQPLNYIIVNLSLADFLVSLTGGTISFLTNYHGYFFLGRWACVLEGFAVTFFGKSKVCFGPYDVSFGVWVIHYNIWTLHCLNSDCKHFQLDHVLQTYCMNAITSVGVSKITAIQKKKKKKNYIYNFFVHTLKFHSCQFKKKKKCIVFFNFYLNF